MKKAIAISEKMDEHARQIVAPGIEVMEVFAQPQHVAIHAAGEPLTDLLRNDFACGVIGGPPRAGRKARDGEIYILDLSPSYRRYFAGSARNFCCESKPHVSATAGVRGNSFLFRYC